MFWKHFSDYIIYPSSNMVSFFTGVNLYCILMHSFLQYMCFILLFLTQARKYYETIPFLNYFMFSCGFVEYGPDFSLLLPFSNYWHCFLSLIPVIIAVSVFVFCVLLFVLLVLDTSHLLSWFCVLGFVTALFSFARRYCLWLISQSSVIVTVICSCFAGCFGYRTGFCFLQYLFRTARLSQAHIMRSFRFISHHCTVLCKKHIFQVSMIIFVLL